MTDKFLDVLGGTDFVTGEDLMLDEVSDEYFSSGSLALNALISGSVFGGYNRKLIVAFAGEKGTGKSYFTYNGIKSFQVAYPDGYTFFFETEGAPIREPFKQRGIDAKRVIFPEDVFTVEDFSTKAMKIIDGILNLKEKGKPVLFVLDSLGMLSTNKETADMLEGKDVSDMTRAKMIRRAFRPLTKRLSNANIPMLVTNHTYAMIGAYGNQKEVAGGGGLQYAASTILTLTKSKAKDGDDIIGAVLKAKTYKSRLTKENKVVECLLTHDNGLDPYYGLADIAVAHGMMEYKKISNRGTYTLGSDLYSERDLKEKGSEIWNDARLKELDVHVQKEFKYGLTNLNVEVEEEPEPKKGKKVQLNG